MSAGGCGTAGPSIRPSDMQHQRPTCADVDYFLITRVSVRGKILKLKLHADCHIPGCKRCGGASGHEMRFWERRGWKFNQVDVARAQCTAGLLAAGCNEHLTYQMPDGDRVKLLQAVRRSHQDQGKGGVFFLTKDGTTHLLVNRQSAALVQSKVGPPVASSAVDAYTVGGILALGYKRVGGWGDIGSARAEVLLECPRSYNTPLHSPLTIREFSSRTMTTERGLEKLGYKLPDWARGKLGKAPAVRPEAGSNIDASTGGVVPSNKEDDVQEEHTELLRQIATNTAVLPGMAQALTAIRQILADYDAGRINRDERDRRISRWVH